MERPTATQLRTATAICANQFAHIRYQRSQLQKKLADIAEQYVFALAAHPQATVLPYTDEFAFAEMQLAKLDQQERLLGLAQERVARAQTLHEIDETRAKLERLTNEARHGHV